MVHPSSSAPRRPSPPGTVITAACTQFATSVFMIVYLLLALSTESVMRKDYEHIESQELLGPEYSAESSFGLLTLGLTAVGLVMLVIAIGYVVLGIGNLRGWRPTRILSWVASGILLLGCGPLGAFAIASGLYEFNGGRVEYDPELVGANLDLPSWYLPFELGAYVVFAVGSAAIIILLAIPPSNRHFRRLPPVPPAPALQPLPPDPDR